MNTTAARLPTFSEIPLLHYKLESMLSGGNLVFLFVFFYVCGSLPPQNNLLTSTSGSAFGLLFNSETLGLRVLLELFNCCEQLADTHYDEE